MILHLKWWQKNPLVYENNVSGCDEPAMDEADSINYSSFPYGVIASISGSSYSESESECISSEDRDPFSFSEDGKSITNTSSIRFGHP